MSDQEDEDEGSSPEEITEAAESKSVDNKTLLKPIREPDLQNISRVAFTPAVTKEIISKHSGSILVKDEPIVALTTEYIQRGTEAFRQYSSQRQVNEEKNDTVEVNDNVADFVSSSNLGLSCNYFTTITRRM